MVYDEASALSNGFVLYPRYKDFVVKDLEELKILDEKVLKEGYELKFEGALPDLSATVINNLPSDLKSLVSYDITQNDNKLGGKIIVKVNADPYSLESAGYILSKENIQFEEEIKDGLVPFYINDFDSIDDTTKKALLKQYNDLILAQVSKGVYENIYDV